MHRNNLCALLFVVILSSSVLCGQNHADIANHVRGEMSFLAGDALRGRGSATHDEFVAASYVASQFQTFGLQSAQVQRVALPSGGATYNALAVLKGSDAEMTSQVILLSSHLDHLGAHTTPTGEVIFHGADDDASGTAAVLELARAFASLPKRPRRSIVFVCFGSEETGGQGDRYFLEHPPVPLSSIVANLEFEMIGRPDSAVRSGQLWLTGWERTDLGPSLVLKGAPLVPDPHPAEQFFQRSDNFALALQGIVAQTVSSYGLGAHYHQPTDDLAHIDFDHLTSAIEHMIPSIKWLANSKWRPAWKPGARP